MTTATPTKQKCVICGGPATKKVLWVDGRAYQPSCEADVGKTKAMLKAKNGDMAEVVEGVQDLSDLAIKCIDLVSSKVYPSLERKPGGPDNWVEAAGGLPPYIERIAKHLHYEKGFTISHAIATARNTVKRWMRKGKVAKYGDPNNKHVTSATAAKAAAADASWRAKTKIGAMAMADEIIDAIDLIDLAFEANTSAGEGRHDTLDSILSSGDFMDTATLARRTGEISDPALRHEVRMRVLNLAGFDYSDLIDLAEGPGSTIAPKKAKGKTKDGRPSFKGQGKFKHGFIPVDQAAKEAKAKGSPKAMVRMGRLFGGTSSGEGGAAQPKGAPKPKARKTGLHVQAGQGRAGQRSALGRKDDSQIASVDDKGVKERAQSIGQLHRAKFVDTHDVAHSQAQQNREVSKQTRLPKRATQNWDEIPSNLKTVRNGKRYVLAVFGGKNTLTEWVGGVNEVESTPLAKRKVMRTLTAADAKAMTSGQIRAMLKNQRQISPQVRKALNKALQAKIKEQHTRA